MADTYFISYAGVDRPWAEWVAWQLKQDGHQPILDVWDWRTGDNFVRRMDEALERADAVIALFSKAYFEDERWTGEEWTNAVARQDRVIPLAVEPLTNADVRPLLASRIRKDLHGLEEPAAVAALREAVHGGRRPTEPPPLPGDEAPAADKPRLPGSSGRPEVWNVRRRNPDFSGREAQIADLRDGLLGGEHSVVYALHGMGGIGKTQLAVEYAHRFAGQYDLVWWVDAEQGDQVPVHYGELADQLGVAAAEAGAEHNARTLLRHLSGRSRWLIILDNAENPEQIEPWLPEGPGHVLITSRNPNWRRLARPTPLHVFTRADSLAYLQGRIPGITGEAAGTLAEELGDLPLALAQAAGVVENGMTVDRYRRLLDESTGRILGEGKVPDYPAPLGAAVGIAVDRLGVEHADAAALLRIAAFLGPEPIPTEWLENARPRLSTIPGDPDDLMWTSTALEPLRRFSLARIDGETFQVHRLTQAVLRDHADPAHTKAIHDDAATVLATVAPGSPNSPVDWPAWASLASHLVAQHVDAVHRTELRAKLLDAVDFLIRSAQSRTAAEVATTLREAWTEQSGPDDPDVLTCTQYLGHATSDLGDFREARLIIEDALARRRRTLGDDHPHTLRSANDLGTILSRLGDKTESCRIHEDTLVRRRRVLGEDHPDTLQSASNLGSARQGLGESAEARRMHEDTLARRRRLFGEDHPDTAHSVHCLSGALHGLGEYREARRLREETWARRRAMLGDDHPNTLTSANNLAHTLYALGEFESARRIGEENLARLRRVLGEDHPETLGSVSNLACTLYALGEVESARRMDEDTLARRRRILGEDHSDTLISVNNLAVTLLSLGEYRESRRLSEEALTRRRRVLGEDHPSTLVAAHGVACALHHLRDHAGAARLLEDVLARQRRILGDAHPDTQETTRSLATTYTSMGLKHKAQKLLAKKQPKRRFGRKGR